MKTTKHEHPTPVTSVDIYSTQLDRLARSGSAPEHILDEAVSATRLELVVREDPRLATFLDGKSDRPSAIQFMDIDSELEGIAAASVTAEEELDRLTRNAETTLVVEMAAARLTDIYAAADVPLPVVVAANGAISVDWGLDESLAEWFTQHLGFRAEDCEDPEGFWAQLLDRGAAIEGAVHKRWAHLASLNEE